MAKKIQRYQKIALEAAKQSGRGVIPQIRPLCTLQQEVEQLPETSLVFYEKGGARLCELLDGKEERIGLFVGSEGGFEQSEVLRAQCSGAQILSLGSRILRCETAPVAATSIIMSLTGNM